MKAIANVLLIEDNKILLLHNKKHDIPRVESPGGKIEEGETPEECAIREAKEECDIQIKIESFFGKSQTISEHGEFYEVYTYVGKIISGTPRLVESDKFSLIGWYSFEDLMKFKDNRTLAPNFANAINELKRLFIKSIG